MDLSEPRPIDRWAARTQAVSNFDRWIESEEGNGGAIVGFAVIGVMAEALTGEHGVFRTIGYVGIDPTNLSDAGMLEAARAMAHHTTELRTTLAQIITEYGG